MGDRAPPRHRSMSCPASSMLPACQTKHLLTQDVLDQIRVAKQKQHDRKTHKMISFRRPLKNQASWEKKPANTLDRLASSKRVMKDSTPFKMDAVIPPSSLMIPKQVRPSDPRDDSIFAMVYNDEDYLQVPLRPIKGLKVDSRYTQSVVNEDTHSLAQSHPPPSKNLSHKKSRSPRKLKFKRKTVAASFRPRRNTNFLPIKNMADKHSPSGMRKKVVTDLHLSTSTDLTEFPRNHNPRSIFKRQNQDKKIAVKEQNKSKNMGKDEGVLRKCTFQIARDDSSSLNKDDPLPKNMKEEANNICSPGNSIYPSNEKFDLEKYKRLYLDSKMEKKLETLPWKAFNKYSTTYRKVVSHKVEIVKDKFVENETKKI
eukprot:g12486.t1